MQGAFARRDGLRSRPAVRRRWNCRHLRGRCKWLHFRTRYFRQCRHLPRSSTCNRHRAPRFPFPWYHAGSAEIRRSFRQRPVVLCGQDLQRLKGRRRIYVGTPPTHDTLYMWQKNYPGRSVILRPAQVISTGCKDRYPGCHRRPAPLPSTLHLGRSQNRIVCRPS